MIRVAIIAPTRERCSIADYVRLHAGLFPKDVRIRVVPLPDLNAADDAWKSAAQQANQDDVVHVQFEYGLFDPVKPYRNRFARFMRALRPNRIVTLHDAFPMLEPRWRAGAPYRLRDLVRDTAYLPYFSTWAPRLYGLASLYIVHTEELLDIVATYTGKARVCYLPMPVPAAQAPCEGGATSSPLLVTPGFVKPHKGYVEFLDVLAEHDAWRWIIAGGAQDERDASCLEKLKGSIARRRLSGRVEITGYLPRGELERCMGKATLAVFPFRRTAGSSSIAWAIATGLPIAASDLPAVRSMSDRGAGIELISATDRRAWSSRLEDLLRNSARLSTLACANRAYARSTGFDRLAEATAEIYRRVR